MHKSRRLIERYKLKLHVNFHQISLNVKFSCKIALALKNQDNKILNQTLPKALTRGSCEINQDFYLDWQYQYNNTHGQYTNNMMQVDVLVHSTKGIIHGGMCLVDVTKSFSRLVFPLKKCSDKAASLMMTCSVQRVHTTMEGNDSSRVVYTPHASRQNSIQKKFSRIRSQNRLFTGQAPNDSVLSISKISVSSNSRLEKFFRNENDQLTAQNDLLKQKIKNCEKRERQLFQQLKQVTLKCDKISSRCTELQGLNELNEMLIVEKDKYLKHFQQQNMQIEDQLDIYIDQIKMLEKKLQYKDEVINGREQKLGEKLISLEQQLIEARNKHLILLSTYEESERASTLTLKEKDRQSQLQKARLILEINKKDQEIHRLLCQKSISKDQQQEIRNLVTQRQHQQLINQLAEKNNQISELKLQILKLNQEKQDISAQIDAMKKVQEERLTLKKKINEAQTETSRSKVQQERVSQSLMFSQSKVEQLTVKLSKSQIQKRKMAVNNEKYKDELAQLQSKSKKLEKDCEQLKNTIKDLKNQSKSEQRKKDQQLKFLTEQKQSLEQNLQMMTFHKAKLQYENSDMKEEIITLNRTIKENNSSMNSLREEINHLQQQINILEEQNEHAHRTNQQLRHQISDLEVEVDSKQRKTIEKNQELKIIENKLSLELNKMVGNGLAKMKQCEELDYQSRELRETIKQLEQQLQLTQNELQQQKQKGQINYKEINEVKDENVELKRYLFQLESTISDLSRDRSSESEDIILLNKKMAQQEQEMTKLDEKIAFLTFENEALKGRQNQLAEYTSSVEKDLQLYQQGSQKIMIWITTIFQNSKQIDTKQIPTISSETISSALLKIVQNRNQIMKDLQRQLQNLKQEKQYMQEEIMKIGQQLFEQRQQYEEELSHEIGQKGRIMSDFAVQRQQLLATIQAIQRRQQEEKITGQNYFRQTREVQHRIEQLENEVKQLKNHNQQLEDKLRNEQREVIELNKKYQLLNRKQTLERKSGEDQREVALSIEKQRLAIQIDTLKRISKKREEDLLLNTQRNKYLQEKLLQTQIQSKKYAFDLSVQKQLQQQLQIKYKQVCAIRDELMSKNEELSQQLEANSLRSSQKDIKIAHHSNKYEEQNSQIDQLSKKNSQLTLMIEQFKAIVEDREFQIKQLTLKLKQMESESLQFRKNYEQQRNQADRDISVYKVLIEQAQGVIQGLQASKLTLEEELSMKKIKLAQAEIELELIRKDIIVEQTTKQSLQQEFAILTINYNHCKSELQRILQQSNEIVDEKDREIQQLQFKLKNIQEDTQNFFTQESTQIISLQEESNLK